MLLNNVLTKIFNYKYYKRNNEILPFFTKLYYIIIHLNKKK